MIIRLDLKIFIFLVLYYITKQIKIYSIIMLFALIHEMGHLFAGVFLNMPVKRVNIIPFGLSIEFTNNRQQFRKKVFEIKNIIIAISGPLTNIIFFLLGICFIDKIEVKNMVIYSNLLIAIFNLLPIYPLDGGRILKSTLNLYLDEEESENYTRAITKITLFFLSTIFSILIYYFKNLAFLFIIIYLWCIVEKQNYETDMWKRVNKYIKRYENFYKK